MKSLVLLSVFLFAQTSLANDCTAKISTRWVHNKQLVSFATKQLTKKGYTVLAQEDKTPAAHVLKLQSFYRCSQDGSTVTNFYDYMKVSLSSHGAVVVEEEIERNGFLPTVALKMSRAVRREIKALPDCI